MLIWVKGVGVIKNKSLRPLKSLKFGLMLVADIDGRRAAGRVLKLHSHQNGVSPHA